MIRLDPVRHPPDIPGDVQWFLRCMILHGARTVGVDVDGGRVTGIRFSYRGGPERRVEYDRPALPCLIVGRGRS